MPKTNKLEDVFKFIDTKNNDPSKCWPWTGVLGGRDGRGYISINNKKMAAHRVVYELFNGPIPEGQVIRHECDNPRCCNPEHLIIGTRTDNELDKYKRGRAGVPLHIVNEIHRLQREASRNGTYLTNKQLADQVNNKYDTHMVPSTVSRILRGDTRKQQKIDFEQGDEE